MPQMSLDAFREALVGAAGDNLVSLVLFGSAARGDYDKATSDLNTLLVLRDAAPAALRPLGEAVGTWVKGGQPPPLILSEEGLRASTDVFPIEIEDMRQAHRVLAGADPFEGLRTTRDDLRRELEREARGKLIQLNAGFVASESSGKALGALLETSAKTFFVLFRAALRLSGEEPPVDHRALVDRMAGEWKLDAGAFGWVLDRLGGKKERLAAYDPRGERYVEAIRRFVAAVDQYRDSGGA